MRKLISSGWRQSQAQYNCRAVRLPVLIATITTLQLACDNPPNEILEPLLLGVHCPLPEGQFESVRTPRDPYEQPVGGRHHIVVFSPDTVASSAPVLYSSHTPCVENPSVSFEDRGDSTRIYLDFWYRNSRSADMVPFESLHPGDGASVFLTFSGARLGWTGDSVLQVTPTGGWFRRNDIFADGAPSCSGGELHDCAVWAPVASSISSGESAPVPTMQFEVSGAIPERFELHFDLIFLPDFGQSNK